MICYSLCLTFNILYCGSMQVLDYTRLETFYTSIQRNSLNHYSAIKTPRRMVKYVWPEAAKPVYSVVKYKECPSFYNVMEMKLEAIRL